ncbi:hypothetical protein [Sphingobacterium humi]|uniref:DUF4397 domain-containing protein n=1 Tax=Sphingobacterium humi TaxID=1796905 RepID=A0A6N8KZS3_9SPHI|nr:hypothetical protein [Sphingobacterium humi]MVZ62586.1 hypothetical protein [Sphingobacterium humi]
MNLKIKIYLFLIGLLKRDLCDRKIYLAVILWTSILFIACKKDKIDFSYLQAEQKISLSNTRIINFGKFKHVVLNGDTITYKGKNLINGNPPAKYFQEPGGLLGENWTIPTQLFENNKSLAFELINEEGLSNKFTIPADSNKQMDYYTLPTEGYGQPWVVPIPRDQTPVTKKDHFKIRIINLTKIMPPLPVPVDPDFGPLENLYGAVSLAYADGSLVSSKTTNIDVKNRVSDYVEVPYGTYQFKILTADGRQISAAVHGVNSNYFPERIINPKTSRINFLIQNFMILSNNTYAPLEGFEAGGTYTIVVLPQKMLYGTSMFNPSILEGYQNQFKILEDSPISRNQSFFKIQGVNAGIDQKIRFFVNGKSISKVLGYGEYSEPEILLKQNPMYCEIKNINGKLLKKIDLAVQINQNISLYAWEDQHNKLNITPVSNQLSPELNKGYSSEFGEFNRVEYTSYAGFRFLNFSPDEQLINFVIDKASIQFGNNEILDLWKNLENRNLNLEPGIPKLIDPYSIRDEKYSLLYSFPFKIDVFRSKSKDITPGTIIPNVQSFLSSAFVLKPELYTKVGRDVPSFTGGIYSVVLIGRTKKDADLPAKIISIKHTK